MGTIVVAALSSVADRSQPRRPLCALCVFSVSKSNRCVHVHRTKGFTNYNTCLCSTNVSTCGNCCCMFSTSGVASAAEPWEGGTCARTGKSGNNVSMCASPRTSLSFLVCLAIQVGIANGHRSRARHLASGHAPPGSSCQLVTVFGVTHLQKCHPGGSPDHLAATYLEAATRPQTHL